jgi:uncharacterized surface protein with fasciclin (FAS1) repeats
MNIKKNIKVAFMALAALLATGPLTSCSDEPDSEYFYAFTGEMMSDYMKNREQYSEFAAIVEKANLMSLLSTYGKYTCFMPDNAAIDKYLQSRGLSSVDELSAEDCDTIARTHLVNNMYSTFEMNQECLPDYNLLGRYIATSQGMDEDSNAVVVLEGMAHIIFEKTYPDGSKVHQNDSVENGIVQPIDMVIEKSNSLLADILRDNDKIGIFYEALIATKVDDQIRAWQDPDYEKEKLQYKYYKYKSHVRNEVAWVPDHKRAGFTVFVEPDSLLKAKFVEYGIDTSKGNLHALYDLAVQIYDPVYGSGDAEHRDDQKPGWQWSDDLSTLKDSINPLKRYIQYHILNRSVKSSEGLVALVVEETKEPFGFETRWLNAVEWYHTLLPHTMIKVETLSKVGRKDVNFRDIPGIDIYGIDADKKGRQFLNRRYEAPEFTFRGSLVDNVVETTPVHDALNGHYFYVDDIVKFDKDVRDKVQNMRIRMDFSTVFPELMSNNMRLQGNFRADDGYNSPADESENPKNGKNYQFPMGYLDGVTFNSSGHLIYRRPHWEFWSWQGDEWNLFGDYDFTFRIPPVPFSGEWQIRLGFAPLETRGVMQVYFGTDPKNLTPQGIPLDMIEILNSEMYLGKTIPEDDSQLDTYRKTSIEDLAAEQKVLKNLGAYRGPRSCYNISNNGAQKNYSWGITHMMRRILCQTYIDATKDHYLRFRVASDGKQGNNNEFMFDYLELVPKSVYGIEGEGDMEDDL